MFEVLPGTSSPGLECEEKFVSLEGDHNNTLLQQLHKHCTIQVNTPSDQNLYHAADLR